MTKDKKKELNQIRRELKEKLKAAQIKRNVYSPFWMF